MAVIYTDTTNKYELSNYSNNNVAQSYADKIGTVFTSFFTGVGESIRMVLPFEKLSSLKNERLVNEQTYSNYSDKIQSESDKNMIIGIIVIVIILAVVFIVIKRKR